MAGKKERELAENIKALEKNLELVDGDEIKQKIMDRVAAQSAPQQDLEMV